MNNTCSIVSFHIHTLLQESLSQDEALQILGKYCNQTNLNDNRELAIKAVETCAGLPLAISLIGGLRLNTSQRWENAVAIIQRRDINNKRSDYDFNLYGTFDLGLHQLNEEQQALFKKLGAFKRVPISLQTIATLWQNDEEYSVAQLREFDTNSLLKYDDNK